MNKTFLSMDSQVQRRLSDSFISSQQLDLFPANDPFQSPSLKTSSKHQVYIKKRTSQFLPPAQLKTLQPKSNTTTMGLSKFNPCNTTNLNFQNIVSNSVQQQGIQPPKLQKIVTFGQNIPLSVSLEKSIYTNSGHSRTSNMQLSKVLQENQQLKLTIEEKQKVWEQKQKCHINTIKDLQKMLCQLQMQIQKLSKKGLVQNFSNLSSSSKNRSLLSNSDADRQKEQFVKYQRMFRSLEAEIQKHKLEKEQLKNKVEDLEKQLENQKSMSSQKPLSHLNSTQIQQIKSKLLYSPDSNTNNNQSSVDSFELIKKLSIMDLQSLFTQLLKDHQSKQMKIQQLRYQLSITSEQLIKCNKSKHSKSHSNMTIFIDSAEELKAQKQKSKYLVELIDRLKKDLAEANKRNQNKAQSILYMNLKDQVAQKKYSNIDQCQRVLENINKQNAIIQNRNRFIQNQFGNLQNNDSFKSINQLIQDSRNQHNYKEEYQYRHPFQENFFRQLQKESIKQTEELERQLKIMVEQNNVQRRAFFYNINSRYQNDWRHSLW